MRSTASNLSIAVVGGCQTRGLRKAIQAFLPEADVKSWHVGVHPNDPPEVIAQLLPGYDLVVTQFGDEPVRPNLAASVLRTTCKRVLYVPQVVFTGFHPDANYLLHKTTIVPSILGGYHSLLMAAAYSMGIGASRIERLFNSYIYTELGYLSSFGPAKSALLTRFASSDIEISETLEGWLSAPRAFMYTINHPTIDVLIDVAKLTIIKAGIASSSIELQAEVGDDLADSFCWPVYPAIAKLTGTRGSYTFKLAIDGISERRQLCLGEFIETTLASYANQEQGVFQNDLVTAARKRLDAILNRPQVSKPSMLSLDRAEVEVNCLVAEAQRSQANGLLEEAEAKFRAAAVLAPENFKVLGGLADVAVQSKKWNLAYDRWSTVARHYPDNFWSRYWVADLTARVDDKSKAIDLLSDLELRNEEVPTIVQRKIEILLELGLLEKAIVELERLSVIGARSEAELRNLITTLDAAWRNRPEITHGPFEGHPDLARYATARSN